MLLSAFQMQSAKTSPHCQTPLGIGYGRTWPCQSHPFPGLIRPAPHPPSGLRQPVQVLPACPSHECLCCCPCPASANVLWLQDSNYISPLSQHFWLPPICSKSSPWNPNSCLACSVFTHGMEHPSPPFARLLQVGY